MSNRRGAGSESLTSVENPKRDQLDLDDGGDRTHPTTVREKESQHLKGKKDASHHRYKHSHRDEPVLQIPHTLAQLQIRKGQDQRDRRMGKNPRIHIIRRPPQPNKGPFRHDLQLVTKRRRESRGGGLTLSLLSLEALCLDPCDFIEGFFELR